MSKAVKIGISAALIVAGAVTGNVSLIVAGVANLATTLTTPKAPGRQASATTLSLGEVPREAVFGEAVVAGSLVDAFNYGGKYGTDWEVVIVALADHECEALVGFYVGDAYVPFAGDGDVAGYKGQLKVFFRPGTENQALPAIVTSHGPGWTANDNGAGVAYVVVAYKADEADAKKPVWTAGRPRFAWRLKGAKCYQARKDGSVPGGAGPHRRDDPSTWEWTDNPIDCRYNWVRGMYACNRVGQPTQLLVGRGLSAVEAPPANVFGPANLCDEPVALDGGGTEKRYRIGGLVSAGSSYIETEGLFASACAGVIVQPEGSVEIEPGHAKSPVAFITDDDIVVGTTVEYSEYRSRADQEWVNTVIGRYVEPAQKWGDHSAPIRRVDADVIADGGPREETLQLPMVTWATQAGRCSEIRRRFGRLQKTGALTLGPRFAELEEGDWIVWTSKRHLKGASVTFRAEAHNLDEKWRNRLSLREIHASIFSAGPFIPDLAVALKPVAPPEIGVPDVGAWTLEAGQLAGEAGAAIPALLITGAVEEPYVQEIRFEYRIDDASDPSLAADWVSAGSGSPGVKRKEIASIAPGKSYHVAISYVIGGEPGERRVLGPVTVGDLRFAGQVTSLISTSSPSPMTISASDTTITIPAHDRSYADRKVPVTGATTAVVAAAGSNNHVFYDDEARAGGAVLFQATTVAQDAQTTPQHPIRHYVGSIPTPAAGGTSSGSGSTPPGWSPEYYDSQNVQAQ